MSHEQLHTSNSDSYSCPHGHQETPKSKLLARLGTLAGIAVLGISGTAVDSEAILASQEASLSIEQPHPLEYVGIASNRILVPRLKKAQQAASEIAAMNANTVKVYESINTDAYDRNKIDIRLCNAAEAARQNNLTLEISLIEHNGNKPNYIPTRAGAVTKYIDRINSILWNLAGPNANKAGTDGTRPCVKDPLDKLIISEFNEVNSRTFNSTRDPAKKYAYLVSRAGPAMAQEADKINRALQTADEQEGTLTPRHFTLIRTVGGLAASSHNPVNFLSEFDGYLKDLGVRTPPFELLALHPYPADPTANPCYTEAALHDPIENQLESAWGKDKVSIIYDEIGVKSIPDNSRKMYGQQSLKASGVSAGMQGNYYHDAILEASAEEDVVGLMIFQGRDAKNDGWPTGPIAANGEHKPSWNKVAQGFQSASEGTLTR